MPVFYFFTALFSQDLFLPDTILSTLNPQPSTLNPQPSTLNPQPSTAPHRWHTEQFVFDFTWYSSTSCRPMSGRFSGGTQVMSNTASFLRTNFAGSRWQSRHHSMCSVAWGHVSGMRSTRPWQVTQPMPFAT